MMFTHSRNEICRMIRESLQGPNGKYSQAKIVIMFGFFAATFFVWKLLLTGALTLDFFITYLAFISGHSNLSKWIDTKSKDKE